MRGRTKPCSRAAIRAGVGLPYGCKNGACGSCKGKVLEGDVIHHKPHQQRALSARKSCSGFALFCCAVPEQRPGDRSARSGRQQRIPGAQDADARDRNPDRAAPDVTIMSLQLPANEALAYRAGQYIEFLLKDGKRRAYSIANAPSSAWIRP